MANMLKEEFGDKLHLGEIELGRSRITKLYHLHHERPSLHLQFQGPAVQRPVVPGSFACRQSTSQPSLSSLSFSCFSPLHHLLRAMARNLVPFLVLLFWISICQATSIFQPISDSHRYAALELFRPTDGVFGSLEETHEALRTFDILGIQEKLNINAATCKSVSEVLSSSAVLKDLFYALRVNDVLKCDIKEETFESVTSRLTTALNDARSLFDFYYSIGSLLLLKERGSRVDLSLNDADGTFQSIKALSQSDGRWRYSSNNPESSTYAAGLALESLAGIVSLASPDIDQNMIDTVKNDILKLFDSIEKYDDGALYFEEKVVDAYEHHGPLATTSSVVRGLTAFTSVTSGSLNLPGDTIFGLAKFFLGIGVPGDAKDLFDQIDSLACLEANRVSIPLILSLPATVLSLTKEDKLKVSMNTVLGEVAPPLTVKIVKAFLSGSKDTSIIGSQELKFDPVTGLHILDAFPKTFDVGNYVFVFEVVLHDSEHMDIYATGGKIQVPIYISGVVKIENAEIAVLDSDLGSVETQKKLDLVGESVISLSANHLQKLRLLFQLATPQGHGFKPHQENSFLRVIGHIDLDLPEAPEKAARPPLQPVDLYSRYGPKAEISHIFRAPEKRPPKELSLTFLGLTFLPFLGFLVGLLRLGVNLKNFPTSTVPATFAFLFHLSIAAVILLYTFFWLKLDLFTTLKALGILGVLLVFLGHRTLSHLASTSAKLKSA
ncbi:dolichyl-diphosphooligosaccharide--protein glycosyltransferase subunit 2 [Cucumis melo var. makuwa]|uniref:Dolichyl-diphosphooligosaccharide--protein glycosyltransferase subunit 2 n=1 Tax=Cucumis melo var. makuwa TaxID=1194695 RepID=A0A5D3E468_CUCMM|nr:dolichyl-diphosphooligosaccharide--protein glycosyltransferase subunit 2 [Cucumis melo var. makuwa]